MLARIEYNMRSFTASGNQSGISQSVYSLSRVWLFATPWTAACQASLSITNSRSLLKLMSIESVMPSSHLHPLSSPSPAFNLSQPQGFFNWVSSLLQVAEVLKFQLQHQSSEYSGQISFKMDCRRPLYQEPTMASQDLLLFLPCLSNLGCWCPGYLVRVYHVPAWNSMADMQVQD